MITLTAKINLLSGDNKALSLGSDNLSGNNISRDLSKVVGVKKQGSNPFIIGASKLGDGSTFSRGVDYFIGDQLSNENGIFANPYKIKINSKEPLNSLAIAFDTVNNRHPNKIKVTSRTEEHNLVITRDGLKEVDGESVVYYSMPPFMSNLTMPTQYYDKTKVKSFTARLYSQGKIEDKTFNDGYKVVLDYATYADNTNICAVGIEIQLPENDTRFENFFDEVSYIVCDVEYVSENDFYEEEFLDDDSIFTMANFNNFKNCEFTIEDWNKPKYPLVITGIYLQVDIEIDYRNLISISRSIFDRSDLKLPSFGIISNTGNIEFNDIDGEVRDYAEQLLLQSGLSCEIKLNNTLVDGASERIGLFETDQWNYENDSRVVSVSIKDDLEEWQDINVEGLDLQTQKSFNWLYEYLWGITTANGNYNMLSIDSLDDDTVKVLNNTYIRYPLLKNGSLWQQWTKLCQVCQLHIYKNNNGVIVCRYNGGN